MSIIDRIADSFSAARMGRRADRLARLLHTLISEKGEATGATLARRAVALYRGLDADAIVAELKSKLANFKIPKRCFVVNELPRNTMGKVQKALLREQHKQLYT